MRRFSSGVVRRTWCTCSVQVLPTTVTVGVSASSRARMCGSEAASWCGRRVEPKAASRAWARGSERSWRKNSASFLLDSGKPPSM